MKFRNPAARAFGWLLAFTMLLVAGGCNEDLPTDPVDIGGDVEGTWEALSFAGSQMPLEDFINDPVQGTCRRTLERVTLSFLADSTYTWVEETITECQASAPSPATATFTGTYRIDGVKLFMTDSEGASEQESSFSVEQSLLTMRQRVGSIRLVSIFQRA